MDVHRAWSSWAAGSTCPSSKSPRSAAGTAALRTWPAIRCNVNACQGIPSALTLLVLLQFASVVLHGVPHTKAAQAAQARHRFPQRKRLLLQRATGHQRRYPSNARDPRSQHFLRSNAMQYSTTPQKVRRCKRDVLVSNKRQFGSRANLRHESCKNPAESCGILLRRCKALNTKAISGSL